MDIASVAKRIREAIMDRAEDEGRVFHASSIEDEVTKILQADQPAPTFYPYAQCLAIPMGPGTICEAPGEWR